MKQSSPTIRMTTITTTGLDPAETRALAAGRRRSAARRFRDEFLIPPHDDGEQAYFCGNSLGLQPRATREAVNDELDDWRRLAVEAHFRGRHPWMPYHEFVRDDLAEAGRRAAARSRRDELADA